MRACITRILRRSGCTSRTARNSRRCNRPTRRATFFLKPNGVFYRRRGTATPACWKRLPLPPRGMTCRSWQPNPARCWSSMAISIHGSSAERARRGTFAMGSARTGTNRAVFAISRGRGQPWQASPGFIRDALGCRNALFFDGTVSALHDGKRYRVGGEYPVGPMLSREARKLPSIGKIEWARHPGSRSGTRIQALPQDRCADRSAR